MQYTMTIEQVRRIKVSFDAPDNESALQNADLQMETMNDARFETACDKEYNYCLQDPDGEFIKEY